TANPIGDCAVVSGTSMVVRSSAMAVRSSNSDLPRLEIDARIDPSIGEIGQQVYDKPDEGQDIKRCEYHRIVPVEHALEAEEPDAVERKDGFDQQRAGEERVHECPGKAGDHDQHGVAKYVPVKHLALAATLRPRG